jgi:hypothetical protein
LTPQKNEKLDLQDFLNSPVRSASMQLWREAVDIRHLRTPIVRAIALMNLWPARIEVSHERATRLQIRKWRSESDADLDEFGDILHLSAISALPGKHVNKSEILKTFTISKSSKSLYVESQPDTLTVELAIEILNGFLPSITPLFGFGEVTKRVWSFQYHLGVQGSGMDKERTERAQILEQVRFAMPGEESVLGHRLFDIHELNFLTQRHLNLPVFGTTLKKWIAAGQRGELRQLKPDVFAWVIPDSFRVAIRTQFLRAGNLIVKA